MRLLLLGIAKFDGMRYCGSSHHFGDLGVRWQTRQTQSMPICSNGCREANASTLLGYVVVQFYGWRLPTALCSDISENCAVGCRHGWMARDVIGNCSWPSHGRRNPKSLRDCCIGSYKNGFPETI